MSEKKTLYVDELSPEEKELLEIAEKIRKNGQDPVRILKFYTDAQGTVEKVGKETGGFLRKQWEAFKEGYEGKNS